MLPKMIMIIALLALLPNCLVETESESHGDFIEIEEDSPNTPYTEGGNLPPRDPEPPACGGQRIPLPGGRWTIVSLPCEDEIIIDMVDPPPELF